MAPYSNWRPTGDGGGSGGGGSGGAGLTALQCAALGLGAAAALGVAAAAVRRASRVAAARRRLAELMAPYTDARVVITGATSGVGAELARELSRHPSVSVLLGCRDATRGAAVAGRCGAGRAEVARLDCLDLGSVRQFAGAAGRFLEAGGAGGAGGLRLLVNNAGVMSAPGVSADGLEPTWQTNFLAPYLLTELLAAQRGASSASPPLRVVNVSSRLEKRSALTAASLPLVRAGGAAKPPAGAKRPSSYSDSKRALMLWVAARSPALAAEHSTHVHASTPGMVDTQVRRCRPPVVSSAAAGLNACVWTTCSSPMLKQQLLPRFCAARPALRPLADLAVDEATALAAAPEPGRGRAGCGGGRAAGRRGRGGRGRVVHGRRDGLGAAADQPCGTGRPRAGGG